MKYMSRSRQTMELVDYVLQHPLATGVHRDRLAKENLELIKFWEQDPYVMFKDERKLLSILKALPAFALNVQSCTEDKLHLWEADELIVKIDQELPMLLNRWEHYTLLAKSVEDFYASVRAFPLEAEMCRAGRLLSEIISAKAFKLVTTVTPSEFLIADYVTYGERFIDTVEYYESVQPLGSDILGSLREKLLRVEVASLLISID